MKTQTCIRSVGSRVTTETKVVQVIEHSRKLHFPHPGVLYQIPSPEDSLEHSQCVRVMEAECLAELIEHAKKNGIKIVDIECAWEAVRHAPSFKRCVATAWYWEREK